MVVAIEPCSRDFARLKAHIKLNKLFNVRLLKAAISNYSGKADLLIAPEKNSGHNTLGDFGYSITPQGKEQVSVEQLDEIVQRIGLKRVDILKIDIEGAEFYALQGATKTIKLFHPIILVELSDRTLSHQGCASKQIWDFLTQKKYYIYRFDEQTGLPVLAEKKSWFDSENIIAIPRTR